MITCPHCQEQLTPGDYYLTRDAENVAAKCGLCGKAFDPALIYSSGSQAKNFDPIVLWVSNDDPNQVSFPGRADEPVQEGYHAVEITNLAEADRWANKLNYIEKEKTEGYRESERQYWDEVGKQRRSDIRAKIGSNPRAKALFEAVQKYVDAKRERRYSRKLDPRGHFHVISFDSSNRQGYRDESTGWKEKRV